MLRGFAAPLKRPAGSIKSVIARACPRLTLVGQDRRPAEASERNRATDNDPRSGRPRRAQNGAAIRHRSFGGAMSWGRRITAWMLDAEAGT
jgi:hypothetical protein